MPPRHINNARTGLKTLRDNPRLHIVRPTSVATTRFNNFQPTHKSTSISHSILQQKQWRRYQTNQKLTVDAKSMGQRRRIQNTVCLQLPITMHNAAQMGRRFNLDKTYSLHIFVFAVAFGIIHARDLTTLRSH